MTISAPSIVPFGDDAVLVTLGEAVDPDLARATRRLAAALDAERGRGLAIARPVVGYASIRVSFDVEALGTSEVVAAVRRVVETHPVAAEPEPTPERLVEIPTRYGGADGEDLDAVAEATGLTAVQVVEAHASTIYDVFMLGFAPGFAYLGVLAESIAVPRRASPRPRVPAGSVAIAERQTAVYPVESPGGWHLVGRTETRLWDPRGDPPALLAPGDRVRFVPVR
ncbi:MAG TPA: 5-oxoprolinase subunit PxpB [Candidatus Limnocylindrales bacterium]|nr:5-oxoprolinase subunit PxpB [Candidatus Limnocylindrales bacterium]